MPIRLASSPVLMCLPLAAAWAPALRADSVTLKSGGEIRGEFISEPVAAKTTAQVTLRTMSGATVTIVRDDVESMTRRRLIIEEYETRRRNVPDTATGHWEMAEWCRVKSLHDERAAHLQRVIALDPDHVAAHRALAQLWSKRVKLWHGWLAGNHPDKQRQAQAELAAIRDADAVPALARAARAEPDEARRLLFVAVLSQIDGDKPVVQLALQSVVDDSESVRDAALRAVIQKDLSKAVPVYVKALKGKSNLFVNRAGLALGALGHEKALPPLIDALVTRHEYSMEVPNPEPFICTEGQNSTANVVLPPAVAAQLLSSGMMPLVARNMPKPVPGQEPEKEMMTITFEKDETNPGVLLALGRLTQHDFGFDKQAWRKWYNTRRRSAVAGTRSKP